MYQINEMVDVLMPEGHVKRGKVARIIEADASVAATTLSYSVRIYQVIDTTDQQTIYTVSEAAMRKVL